MALYYNEAFQYPLYLVQAETNEDHHLQLTETTIVNYVKKKQSVNSNAQFLHFLLQIVSKKVHFS
jgi:hypothetical protein